MSRHHGPLYRSGQIPDGLATVTMLARLRRRLADGQEPVATLYLPAVPVARRYCPLYKIEDSVQLPPLSPARQARWDAVRTCARCADVGSEPLPLSDDRRVCDDCQRREALAAVRPAHLVLRAAAVDWAREVLADPATVVVTGHQHSHGWPLDLHAATVAGAVLLDVTVWPRPGRVLPYLTRPDRPSLVDADQLPDLLTVLGGHRLVQHLAGGAHGRGWSDGHSPLVAAAEISGVTVRLLTRDIEYTAAYTDLYSPRRQHWLATPLPHAWPSAGLHGLAPAPPVGASTAIEATHQVITGLTQMARDDHPDGPPTCPALPPTGISPCGNPAGAAGTCTHHA